MASPVRDIYDERVKEVRGYLDLLSRLNPANSVHAPVNALTSITSDQYNMMQATLYLMLYNLVESTVVQGLEWICKKVIAAHPPSALSDSLLREWVRSRAMTHATLEGERRLDRAVALVRGAGAAHVNGGFAFDRGGGGNWDHDAIQRLLSNRLHCVGKFSPEVRDRVFKKYRDDLDTLALVKAYRNKLAHGDISFTGCAPFVEADLTAIAEAVIAYLSEFVGFLELYVSNKCYLEPGQPQTAAKS